MIKCDAVEHSVSDKILPDPNAAGDAAVYMFEILNVSALEETIRA